LVIPRAYANRNSLVRDSSIVSPSFAAFSNLNRLALRACAFQFAM
jgi:hypothetical protein